MTQNLNAAEIEAILKSLAKANFYDDATFNAGIKYSDRKDRRTNPPGSFDKAGRFLADERTEAVQRCRWPSRAYPYPEMYAARTAAHCAEVFGAEDVVLVKRIATARDRIAEGDVSGAESLLKKGIRSRKAVLSSLEQAA